MREGSLTMLTQRKLSNVLGSAIEGIDLSLELADAEFCELARALRLVWEARSIPSLYSGLLSTLVIGRTLHGNNVEPKKAVPPRPRRTYFGVASSCVGWEGATYSRSPFCVG